MNKFSEQGEKHNLYPKKMYKICLLKTQLIFSRTLKKTDSISLSYLFQQKLTIFENNRFSN